LRGLVRCVAGSLSLAELQQACMAIAEFQAAWHAGGAPVAAWRLVDAVAPLLDVLGRRR
jgi:hypothetical protein